MLALSVVSALGQSGLAASRLELEITETVLLQDDRAVLDTLHQMRELGVRICMDDFGTGYSSLSYLRSFPFDKIKIDRSFIRELGKENDCVAIIRAVTRLGSSLGMATTAEGVETERAARDPARRRLRRRCRAICSAGRSRSRKSPRCCASCARASAPPKAGPDSVSV